MMVLALRETTTTREGESGDTWDMMAVAVVNEELDTLLVREARAPVRPLIRESH